MNQIDKIDKSGTKWVIDISIWNVIRSVSSYSISNIITVFTLSLKTLYIQHNTSISISIHKFCATIFIIAFIVTYLTVCLPDYSFNSCWSCAISSNCSSPSAIIREVSWSGSVCTVFYSSDCSRTFTKRDMWAASRGKAPRRRCTTVRPVVVCRFWMRTVARRTTACLHMPRSTTRSTTAVIATARTMVMSPTITSQIKSSLRARRGLIGSSNIVVYVSVICSSRRISYICLSWKNYLATRLQIYT